MSHALRDDDEAEDQACNATIDYQVDAGDIGACHQSVEKEDSRGSGSLLLYLGRKGPFGYRIHEGERLV
jgi:hypothetical protein